MKSESGFSFAMASQPFNFKGLGLNMGTHCVELITTWNIVSSRHQNIYHVIPCHHILLAFTKPLNIVSF